MDPRCRRSPCSKFYIVAIGPSNVTPIARWQTRVGGYLEHLAAGVASPSMMRNAAALMYRPAAKKAGVHIEDGQRFGLHNLRHSLSNWLVNKAKVEPKTVQGLLRHSKIQTTLDLYTQED